MSFRFDFWLVPDYTFRTSTRRGFDAYSCWSINYILSSGAYTNARTETWQDRPQLVDVHDECWRWKMSFSKLIADIKELFGFLATCRCRTLLKQWQSFQQVILSCENELTLRTLKGGNVEKWKKNVMREICFVIHRRLKCSDRENWSRLCSVCRVMENWKQENFAPAFISSEEKNSFEVSLEWNFFHLQRWLKVNFHWWETDGVVGEARRSWFFVRTRNSFD